jgi:Flp pilus assembly protein TadG
MVRTHQPSGWTGAEAVKRRLRIAHNRTRDCRRDDGAAGQSLVELALLSPLLLLLMLGTLDLGRMYADYTDLKGAVREGAGYGALRPSDTAGIRNRVLRHGVPAGTTVSVACDGNCAEINATGTIVVTASSTFRPVTLGFFSRFGLDSVNVTAEARMRVMT